MKWNIDFGSIEEEEEEQEKEQKEEEEKQIFQKQYFILLRVEIIIARNDRSMKSKVNEMYI